MIAVGQKIIFANEPENTYAIKAIRGRYAIATRPYNFKKTVYYTIIDTENNIRGAHNLVFNPYDFKKIEDIERCLIDLEKGEIEISERNSVDLIIVT